MMPMTLNKQAPVPPPAYHRAQAPLGPALSKRSIFWDIATRPNRPIGSGERWLAEEPSRNRPVLKKGFVSGEAVSSSRSASPSSS
jgi:hypothetical protein